MNQGQVGIEEFKKNQRAEVPCDSPFTKLAESLKKLSHFLLMLKDRLRRKPAGSSPPGPIAGLKHLIYLYTVGKAKNHHVWMEMVQHQMFFT
jgi:hypothetical protein